MPNNVRGDKEVTIVKWDHIRDHAVGIAMWIKRTTPGNQVSLYGVPRGGTIPAVVIAYLLESVGMEVRLAQALDHLTPNELRNLVVIDDICDSGDTFKVIQKIAPTAKTATLFHRSTATFEPDYYDEYITTENWLQFPWEAN